MLSMEEIDNIFNSEGWHNGRCFGSKSKYSNVHPIDFVVFNAVLAICEDNLMRSVKCNPKVHQYAVQKCTT